MIDLNRYKDNMEFDIIGVCSADKLFYLNDFLVDRINNKLNCEFEPDNTTTRIDPKLSLLNAKSVISCAMNYYYPYEYKDDEIYRLSMSSFGIDYHKVLKEKMENFIELIKKDYDFNYYIQTDSGPLIEREYALKAKLGFIGKNCNLITAYGSFVFLGLIILDKEVKLDYEKYNDSCKDCNLCIKACPTKALYAPYKCDASKCLSYLTQKKGELEEHEKKYFKNMVYGCDICQRVCPKNQNIKKTKHKEFNPILTSVERQDIENLSNKQFKKQFRNHAFSWRGKGIIVRNMNYIDENKNYRCENDNFGLRDKTKDL